MNYELIIIFLLSLVTIEILEYEKSSIHSMLIGFGSMFIWIELDTVTTLTGNGLNYAYIMVATMAIMAFYNMIHLYTLPKQDPDEWL